MRPLVVLAVHRDDYRANADTEVLTAALRRAGGRVELRAWDDPDCRWTDADVVHLHSPWNYSARPHAFRAWLDALGDRLFQPQEVVEVNLSKEYLVALAAGGLPVPPTLVLAPGPVSPDDLRARLGDLPLVTKPLVGAGGRGCLLHADASSAAAALSAATRSQMVQPFVPEVRAGELSAIVVDGEVTHVVRKLPADGEFRVQDHYGGTVEHPTAHEPVPPEVLATVPAAARYARLDYVETATGFSVMEVEMVEPDLFLRFDAAAAAATATALVAAARARGGAA